MISSFFLSILSKKSCYNTNVLNLLSSWWIANLRETALLKQGSFLLSNWVIIVQPYLLFFTPVVLRGFSVTFSEVFFFGSTVCR